MNQHERIEIAAVAMWRHRASDAELGWKGMTWNEFQTRKPDIAEIYRENATVAVKALDEVATPRHDLAAQIKTLGADSLLPPNYKPPRQKGV